MSKGNIIVVGGGLAGLMATIKIAEVGHKVELFSVVPVKRSHSVCAQGGIMGRLIQRVKEIHLGNTLMILFMAETFWLISRK